MTIILCAAILLQAPEELGGRFGGKRNLVARGGGGGDTEDAVLSALKWLARHASEDGSWSAAKVADRCHRLEKYKVGPACPTDFAALPDDVVPAGEPTDDDRAKVTRCADALADGALEERDAASRELVALGPRVLGLLRTRVEGEREAEPKARLQSVIDEIVRRSEPKGERIAATSAALLAFLGAGYTCVSRDTHDGICFGDVVSSGIAFLVKEQAADGGWGDVRATTLAMAVHALCESAAIDPHDDDARKPALRAVTALIARQREDGTWPARRGGDPDPESTIAAAWALHAATWLRADVQKPFDRLRKWAASRKDVPKDRRELAAVGTAIIVTERKRTELLAAIATEIANAGPAADESPALVAARAAVVFHADGPDGAPWKKWNRDMRDRIVKSQQGHSAGCAAGSWKPHDTSRAAGRLGAVAHHALALETYYRLPSLCPK